MVFFFKVQKLQEAAEMVKCRCKNLLHENNLIIRNKNKRLEKVSVKRKCYSVSHVCIVLSLRHFPSACLEWPLQSLCGSSVSPLEMFICENVFFVIHV